MKIPTWLKAVLVLLFIVTASFVAVYLAGILFLIAAKTNPFDATFSTWYDNWRVNYGYAQFKKKLEFAAVASVLISFAGPLIALEVMMRKTRKLHGDAKFASPAEVRASGLLGSKGIIVGKFLNQFLILGGQLFVMLAAPTRGGKGTGIVVPNCLNFSDSIICLDVKKENFDITSGYRAKYGQKVYMFNPFAEDGRTHRWNPLSYINQNPHYRVSDILAIGYVLYPQDGKDAFFNDQARNLFLGLVLYLVETPELPRTISEALRQSSGKGKPVKDYLVDLINERGDSDRPLSEICVDALLRFTSNSENTLASILASFNAPLTIWANPIVDAATSGDDFWLTDVRKIPMSIYLAVSPDKISQSALIMNLFFSQLINQNTKELPSKNPDLKYQCLLLMDEFTAIGKVEIINSAVSYMAGYGLRLLVIIQSMSQLASKYGEQDARTLATNHALQILFTPREQKDANEYSEMLGYQTEKSISTSLNKKALLSINGANSQGESTSDQKRALMLPQELKEMPSDAEIVTLENTKPIMAEKIRYFKDPIFVDRLKEISPSLAALGKKIPTQKQLEAAMINNELNIDIPVLDLDLHMAIIESRKRVVSETDLPADDSDESFNLSALAHDFSELPEVDDEENPSAESVSALVGDFFSRLDNQESNDDDYEDEQESGGGIDLNMLEETDGDGVITKTSRAKTSNKSDFDMDLSILDLD